jgi:hypothetical protein
MLLSRRPAVLAVSILTGEAYPPGFGNLDCNGENMYGARRMKSCGDESAPWVRGVFSFGFRGYGDA